MDISLENIWLLVIGFVLGRLYSAWGTRARTTETRDLEAFAARIPPDQRSRLRDMASRDGKIEAIRFLRAETDLGLRDAKLVVERVVRMG